MENAEKFVSSNKKVKKTDILPTQCIPMKVSDELVLLIFFGLKKYCTAASWKALQKAHDTVQKHGTWMCPICDKDIDEKDSEDAESDIDNTRSVACDCCLEWHHLRCLGLTKAPSATTYICRTCFS